MKFDRLVVLFLGVWVVLFCGMKTLQHYSFGTNACDLSIVDYGFYSTLKGDIMADPFHQYAFGRWEREGGRLSYIPGRVQGWESHFALHFTPILFLFIPLYLAFPGPLILLYIEVVAIGLSALFLFLVARRVIKTRFLSATVVVVYLFYRQLLLGLMHDFHTELLFPALILGAFYFLAIRKKPALYFLFLVLALLVREDIGIYLFFFGIFAVFQLREKRLGWTTSGVSLGYVLLTLGMIIPHFRHEAGGTGFYLYGASYGQDNGSLFQMIGYIIGHPEVLLQGVDLGRFLRILLFNILLPLMFLPLMSAYGLLLLPPLAVMLLSKIPQMYTFGLHYSSTFLPFLFLALIYGMKNARSVWESGMRGRARGSFSVVAAVLLTVNLANSSFWRVISPSRYRALSTYSDVRQLINRIAPQASVAAQSALIPHIPKRQAIVMLPAFYGEDFVIVHRGVNPWPYRVDELDRLISDLDSSPDYELLDRAGEAWLFGRKKN